MYMNLMPRDKQLVNIKQGGGGGDDLHDLTAQYVSPRTAGHRELI